ncbi:Zn(II)2Cys6 transcription factor [Aspergillus homomorphus CBS 101889]|uniref:C2H2 type zinc finger domain protein n=1 Tax=Aspergillus homomorphus (strain CBS 101889) TaxID=1450537 RepID=A0A395I5Y0_ASPHC|nr:hypothetical protein BO97DRAFT_339206 [Aspergillus homomorphus CBS 101889]RAL15205.1 hypothetical protein BO97DRAFT_339206 [Aspergillus homomorphus CBS 101889]
MNSRSRFSCDFPGCSASYWRKAHLNRHKAQHGAQQSPLCRICGREFGRIDTLRRHIRQSHTGRSELVPPIKQACDNCRVLKARCEGGAPCSACLRRHISCSLVEGSTSTGTEDTGPQQTVQPRSSPSAKAEHFIKIFFQKFHPHWPFIHQWSFNITQGKENALLLQSMTVIGMWITGLPSNRSAAKELHAVLDAAIYQQREKWDASMHESASSATCKWPIAMYQAILLHIIFALTSKDSVTLGLDLKPALPANDKTLLKSLVQSCRKLGMFYYPNMLARFRPEEPGGHVWVGVEEVKRFVLALNRVCKIIGAEEQAANVHGKHRDVPTPRSGLLTASELHFPMPTSEALWNAGTEEAWNAAAVDKTDLIHLTDFREAQWISRSATLLDLT